VGGLGGGGGGGAADVKAFQTILMTERGPGASIGALTSYLIE